MHGVHPSAESSSAMCITPQSHEKKNLKNSAVCIIPRSRTPRCASYCGVKLRGVHHTAESSDQISQKNSTVWCTPWSQESNCIQRSQNQNLQESQVAFKGTIRRHPFNGEHISWKKRFVENFFYLLSLNFCARISQRNRNQGPRWVRIMKKMEVENLLTHSL